MPFSNLRPAVGAPADSIAVTFHAGAVPAAQELFYDWGGRYNLRLSRYGTGWLFSSMFDGAIAVSLDGRTIQVFVPHLPASEGLHDILVRRVLPRVATLFGCAAIHGASIARSGRGVLLYGPSGAGKSTLTAAMSRAGWDVLNDDISILRLRDRPCIEPGPTDICVWDDTRTALALERGWCAELPGYDGKVRYNIPSPAPSVSVSLAGCVMLLRDPELSVPVLERGVASEGIKSIVRQLVLFNPGAAPEDLVPSIEVAVEAVAARPFYRLRYPESFAALNDIDVLLQDCLDA